MNPTSRIRDGIWTAKRNILIMDCSCGLGFVHPADRWVVRCPAGHVDSLKRIRQAELDADKLNDTLYIVAKLHEGPLTPRCSEAGQDGKPHPASTGVVSKTTLPTTEVGGLGFDELGDKHEPK